MRGKVFNSIWKMEKENLIKLRVIQTLERIFHHKFRGQMLTNLIERYERSKNCRIVEHCLKMYESGKCSNLFLTWFILSLTLHLSHFL